METGEGLSTGSFESAITELHFSPERTQILKEGYLSAKGNKDLLQARLLTSAWSSRNAEPPQEVQELTQNLEQEWENGTINVKFDTQLEDETVVDKEEILYKKIQRCTDQNEKLKGEQGGVFAVVIPSYWKEEDGLPHTLTSIGEQRLDDTVIVVVSDNNDEEGKEKFDVGLLAKGKGANVATGSIPANIASARRKGVDRALRGGNLSTANMILIGNDSDSDMGKGYLRGVREAYKDELIIATTGPVEFDSDHPSFTEEAKRGRKFLTDSAESGLFFAPGANWTVRAKVYCHIGGHTLDYGGNDDTNLSQKLRDYFKYEGRAKGEKAAFVPDQVIITSTRKLADETGALSRRNLLRYKWELAKRSFLEVTHPEGFGGLIDPRDSRAEVVLGQLRKLRDRYKDYKYWFSKDGEERARHMIRVLRTWDNFYQRVNNVPKVKEAVLNDTQKERFAIDTTFQREFQERGIAYSEGTASALAGTVLQEANREVSVFVIKKPSEKGDGSRYLAVEIERDPSSDSPPIIASLVEIDEGAKERFTKVYWSPERMFFHPDDDYPRTATLIFKTHHGSVSEIPTENVNVFISDDEIKEKASLLLSAYKNSLGEDNETLNVLRDYVPI